MTMNILLTILIAAAVLGYSLYLLVRMLRHHGGGCGCGCGSCPMAGRCHRNEQP